MVVKFDLKSLNNKAMMVNQQNCVLIFQISFSVYCNIVENFRHYWS